MGSSQLVPKKLCILREDTCSYVQVQLPSFTWVVKHTVAYVQVWKLTAKAHKSSHSKWHVIIFHGPFKSSEISQPIHRKGKKRRARIHKYQWRWQISSKKQKPLPMRWKYHWKLFTHFPLHSQKVYYSYPNSAWESDLHTYIYTSAELPETQEFKKILPMQKFKNLIYNLEK